ncbi:MULTISPECIES: O-antigen ligase family protein [Macellibacteroides]|uniref:O-antigen ligase like membrane protein n=1 Tax=Parabacteroides chartae TaxID=1037355 RepID=A0A1T5E817_9BACT|nr:O-antigen ligase family protein [Parabacteroides chartae]SKB79925.1 O-antigen ligase like membrane protein [Parabacteroides chartae]
MKIYNNHYKLLIDHLKDLLISKIWIWLVLVFALYLFYQLILSQDLFLALGIALFPFLIILFIVIIAYSEKGFYPIFISHFILLSISSYMDIKLGVATVLVTLAVFMLIIVKGIYNRLEWKHAINPMLVTYSIWMAYCILEMGNPNHVQEAWNVSITQYAVYPLVCAILVPISIKNKTHIHWLIVIWSIFILFAAFKGYWQKNEGFNEKELYFLYELGGAKTHIIWSGIRYFSVFSDAANYGVHMGMAIIGLGISAIYTKNKFLKIYYLLVTFAAIYGMFISGTRAAIAVPLAGIFLFTLLAGNIRFFSLGAILGLGIFIFFNFTTIGDGNQNIRRMRTAFNPTKDASYQVRKTNQERMKILMSSKPFGYGIGLGGKAEKFHPKELMPYPPDSWMVNVWTDTGIIGLTIYILLHSFLFVYCSWILLFKIKDFRLKGLLTAWLCVCFGYFVAAFANDIMQYPNSIVVYTGFGLCVAGPLFSNKLNQ